MLLLGCFLLLQLFVSKSLFARGAGAVSCAGAVSKSESVLFGKAKFRVRHGYLFVLF